MKRIQECAKNTLVAVIINPCSCEFQKKKLNKKYIKGEKKSVKNQFGGKLKAVKS